AAKWDDANAEYLATVPVCPADVDADLAKKIGSIARAAWELIGHSHGYGRIDMRIAPSGQPYVLEVNPNPDISDDAGLSRMAKARGWEYDELILKVLEEAMARSERRREAEAHYLKIPA